MSAATPEACLIENDTDAANEVDAAFAKRGCFFCLRSGPSPYGSSGGKDRWWMRGWRKVREWSEIVAGPKWKTFIRRFNRGRHGAYAKQTSFNYDPSSYALNFDQGTGQEDEPDFYLNNFSTRYASIPASVKSSMDLGKDGPTFT